MKAACSVPEYCSIICGPSTQSSNPISVRLPPLEHVNMKTPTRATQRQEQQATTRKTRQSMSIRKHRTHATTATHMDPGGAACALLSQQAVPVPCFDYLLRPEPPCSHWMNKTEQERETTLVVLRCSPGPPLHQGPPTRVGAGLQQQQQLPRRPQVAAAGRVRPS